MERFFRLLIVQNCHQRLKSKGLPLSSSHRWISSHFSYLYLKGMQGASDVAESKQVVSPRLFLSGQRRASVRKAAPVGCRHRLVRSWDSTLNTCIFICCLSHKVTCAQIWRRGACLSYLHVSHWLHANCPQRGTQPKYKSSKASLTSLQRANALRSGGEWSGTALSKLSIKKYILLLELDGEKDDPR